MLIQSHRSYSTHISACDNMKTRYAVSKLVTLLACCIVAVLTFTGSSGGEADDERKSNMRRLRQERYGWPFSERSLHLGLVIVIKSHLKGNFYSLCMNSDTPLVIARERKYKLFHLMYKNRNSSSKEHDTTATTVWNDLLGYVFLEGSKRRHALL